ncbi:MAG: hypothetical protein ACLTXI_08640 [Collinsella sp.]
MDDTIAERIQKQVNPVSSLIEDPVVSQTKIDEEKAERDLEHVCMAARFSAAVPDRTPSELLSRTRKIRRHPARHKPARDDFSGRGLKIIMHRKS